MNNFLYIRGFSNNNYSQINSKCKDCNIKCTIIDFDEFDDKIKNKEYTFNDLYVLLKEKVKLNTYSTIITNNISFLVILYLLNDTNLLKKIDNLHIINLNSFLPYNIDELNNLIFPLYSKKVNLPKGLNKNIKLLQNAYQESYEELINNTDKFLSNKELQNKIKITNVLDKKNNLNAKNIKLLKSLGKIKYNLKDIENKLFISISKYLKSLKGGSINNFNKPNVNTIPNLENNNKDTSNSTHSYKASKEIFAGKKLPKYCNKNFNNKKPGCSVDMGSHIQHTFNCYSYFLNMIHIDLIEFCIQNTNDSNLNNRDRCRSLWPQPGDYSDFGLINNRENYTCRNLVNRVLQDFPELKYFPACKHQETFTGSMPSDIPYEENNHDPLCDAELNSSGNIVPRYKDENTKNNYPIEIVRTDKDFSCPKGYYKGSLTVAPSHTYHFYKKEKKSNNDNTIIWTHKDGSSKPRTDDSVGVDITDPLYANRKYSNTHYSDLCGYFCIPKNLKVKKPIGRYKRFEK